MRERVRGDMAGRRGGKKRTWKNGISWSSREMTADKRGASLRNRPSAAAPPCRPHLLFLFIFFLLTAAPFRFLK
ncbi:hypothetical protein BHM03_00034637 [Ensete ventricosum]|nr:hypothetical protein BHM03_00034637 [Ensete ventricosum]